MKKFILTIVLIFIANFFSAQEQQEVNAFQKSENETTGTLPAKEAVDTGRATGSPGNPPEEEIPVDDYLPMLAITAVFAVVYRFRYKIKFFI